MYVGYCYIGWFPIKTWFNFKTTKPTKSTWLQATITQPNDVLDPASRFLRNHIIWNCIHVIFLWSTSCAPFIWLILLFAQIITIFSPSKKVNKVYQWMLTHSTTAKKAFLYFTLCMYLDTLVLLTIRIENDVMMYLIWGKDQLSSTKEH